ncbi:metallophosphoesterase [Yimella sp. cx-573]|nr:metallophosphoesterase [Yimella sp. cx-573]
MHPLTRSALTLGGLGVATLGYASLIERNWYALREVQVPVLPAGARPVRVLQVTDLHLVPRQERRIQWVRDLASLSPDFVLNTGDNCSDPDAVPAVLRAMETLMQFPGAFVLGSNDYFAPAKRNPFRYFDGSHKQGADLGVPTLPWQDMVRGFESGGWTNLTQVRTRLPLGELDVEFVGVDDPHLAYDDYAAVAAPAAADADLTVGVVHAPYLRVLDAMTADGASLVIAGHTHGGQVCLPGYGALVTNCDLGTRRAKGLSRWWAGADNAPSSQALDDAAWLHVSAGLGHNKYNPVRFACRPEATLMTLVPASA